MTKFRWRRVLVAIAQRPDASIQFRHVSGARVVASFTSQPTPNPLRD